MSNLLPLRPSPRLQSAGQPALRAVRISKTFHMDNGYQQVLKDVDFSIMTGELVCILGPSGCGKTTLLNIIAGFHRPSSGTIALQGEVITGPGPDRCVVFQEDALFPWLTVAENVAFGARRVLPKKTRDEAVSQYLEMVGLHEFKDYLPRELSGGMKQRVALARVLIMKPRILLMDEPFGALDPKKREEMQQLLLRLWQSLSQTIVFVTHDLTEAVTLADRILVMDLHAGPIRSDVRVSLPRPRIKDSDDFHRFYRSLQIEL